MEGKYILISGSASPSCPAGRLDMAIQFIENFTEEVLSHGGGVVVLAGGEESTMDERGVPHVFDWVVLRRVARYAETTTEKPWTYARIVMSDEAPEAKIDDSNLHLLRSLEQRKVVERRHIRRETFTGGSYRSAMIEWADAMLAIGGGKGTYSAGTEMTERGKPVLPLDLRLGAMSNDGDGACALHREMMTDPGRFFPATSSSVINEIETLSLNRNITEVSIVVRTAVEILGRELQVGSIERGGTGLKRRLKKLWLSMAALPIVAAGLKIVEFVRGIFL